MATASEFKPTIVGFLCNWCCYGGADLAGVSRFQYPPYLRVIRLMCSGRVDLSFIFRTFAKKADGVFIGGCHLNDCHYNPEGNYDAMGNILMAKRILEKLGVNPERLRLEWVSAGEGMRFAEVITSFSAKVKSLGPLGSSEGIPVAELTSRLQTAEELVPYIKLVERERLRVPVRTEEGYKQFFGSPRVRPAVRRADPGQAGDEPDHGFRAQAAGAGHRDLRPAWTWSRPRWPGTCRQLTERGLVKFDRGQTLVAAV